MSQWKPYQELLEKTGVDRCVIFGHDGSPWCDQYPDFTCTQEEILTMVSAVKGGNLSDFHCNGVKVGGKKFAFLKAPVDDADTVIFQGKDTEKKRSLVFSVSQTAVIVGYSLQEGKTSLVLGEVSKIKNYLKDQNM
ncbi:hypothetical protein ACOMHN_017091 [Nucella lapillus]